MGLQAGRGLLQVRSLGTWPPGSLFCPFPGVLAPPSLPPGIQILEPQDELVLQPT